MGTGVPLRGAALREGTGRSGSGEDRAISVVRDERVYLPGLRDQSGRSDRTGGVVLQPAGRSGEPDQGSQQRRGPGGASLQTVRRQRYSFSTCDAGVQPELLADAVQPGGENGRDGAAAYDAGDGAVAVPVCGRENLASCGKDRSELQRPLSGEGPVSTNDGQAAPHRPARGRLRSGNTTGAVLNQRDSRRA